MGEQVKYVQLSEQEIRQVRPVELSEGERRLLGRSGLPGTELFRCASPQALPDATVKATMALLGTKMIPGDPQ